MLKLEFQGHIKIILKRSNVIMSNTLERIRIQRAKKVLEFHQDQIRYQIRMEDEKKKKKGKDTPQRDGNTIWNTLTVPKYKAKYGY